MGTGYPERIPLKVFIVSSHSIFSIYTGSSLTLKKAVNGILFGLALLMAAARIVTRFHSLKKLHPDDFVLMFACSTFIASQAVFYIFLIKNLYCFAALAFEPMSPQNLASQLEDPEAYYRRALTMQQMEFSSLGLTFASIFAVKICFLLFFYEMITRLRRLILAWKVIFGITIIFWAICICAVFSCSLRSAPNSGK